MERLKICLCENEVHSSGSCSATFAEAPLAKTMDPSIWRNIPEHILDRISSFLPAWSILQLQCVSRKWREYLKSEEFLASWGKNSHPEVLFLMFADRWPIQAAAAYNPSLNKWHLIPLSHFSCSKEVFHDFHMITAAGGLLCTEEVEWPNRSLVICNPVNKSCRKLPPMLDMQSPYVVGMMVNADRSGYRVLVAQDGESLVSQHYDSVSDSWKMNPILYSRVAMLVGMVSIKGSLFCLSFWPLGLIAYNMEEATWSDMQVEMPKSVSSPHLIHKNGQLFLVGGVETYGLITGIKIWKVDLFRKECIEIEQMPDYLFKKFLWNASTEHFSCTGEAGFICFHDGLTPSILMYDMNNKRWWWVPPCPQQSPSPKYLSKYAHNALNALGFPLQPCFIVKA